MLLLHQILLVAIAFASANALKRFSPLRGVLYAMWYGMWLLLWFTVGLRFFGVPGDPDVAAVVCISVLGLLAVASLGMLCGSILRSGLGALQLIAFSSYPFFCLSGMSWPHEATPRLLQWLSALSPLTPWMQAINRAYRLGAGIADIKPELMHLGLLVVAYSVLGLALTRLRHLRPPI